MENCIRSKGRKVTRCSICRPGFTRVLFRSSVHHGAASKGRFERTFSARSTVANETRNNSSRFYSFHPRRPTFATIEPTADFASLFLPNFAPYKREREREKEKSPCKSMDPRLFYAEQSFVSFLSR